MDNQEFWNNRARKHGHTGWSDSVIYAYDQIARMKTIQKIIKSLEVKKETALDFGTGSGDFAALLAGKFKKVLAFDISKEAINIAKNKYGHIQNIDFIQRDCVLNLKIDDNSLDLILSVTVLGHIKDIGELINTITYFKNKLHHDGCIIVFEYSPDSKKNSDSDYQRFSTFDEWLSIFSKCGFRLQNYYGFYHPIESPCKSYQLYRQNIKVMFLKYFKNYQWVKKCLTGIAESILKNYDDFFWKGQKEDILKIMIFKKS